MDLEKLLKGIEYSTLAPLSTQITTVTSDSRRVESGSLFVCIKGMRSDGHDFAAQTLEQGAAVVLCERDLGLGDRQIIVKSTRSAFAEVCENLFDRPLDNLRLIGVTGTNGKTSTTYILKHILEENGYKVGLIGTICNMIGQQEIPTSYTTPDTYELHSIFARMRDEQCDFCLMEVSSQALDQGRVEGLYFETCCFTNLTQDHLDVHGTMENYFAAKCRIFAMSDAAAINADDEASERIVLPQGVKGLYFGLDNASAGCNASNASFSASGVTFDVTCGGETVSTAVPIPGMFSVHNALSALCCAVNVGVPFKAAAQALSTAKGVKGRAEVFPADAPFTVVIDYAHAPDGVENILKAMRQVMNGGRLITLIGCGGDRDPIKRPIMGAAAARLSDFVIVTSDNPRTEEPMSIIEQILPGVKEYDTPYVVIENRREAIEYAVRNAQENDVVVLAGKGHETYQIIGTVKHHFDEREVLAEAFEKIRKEKGEDNA